MIAALGTFFNVFCYDPVLTYHLNNTEHMRYLLCQGHRFILKTSISRLILPVNYIITKQAKLYYILPLLDLLTKLFYCPTQSCSITMVKYFTVLNSRCGNMNSLENINCISKILRMNIMSSYKKS